MPDAVTPQGKAMRLRSAHRPRPAHGAPGHAGFPVVALGASAGGLEACAKLLNALPAPSGMAFILVQHLEPNHKSLLVELLAEHTALMVVQAMDGMLIEREHLYVIPPGSYLSVDGGALRLSALETHHGAARGARLPFDVLLPSLAQQYGARAACVVLSGTGADGTAGLRAIHDAGGLVIAQEPEDAIYDGMPCSAIGTGVVDRVIPAADIPRALAEALDRHGPSSLEAAPAAETPGGTAAAATAQPPAAPPTEADAEPPEATDPDPLQDILKLLRARTRHDFTLYKRGTLERRVERRIGIAFSGTSPALPGKPGGNADLGRYLDKLRGDAGELDLLAKDLLMHVTGFFRDPQAYAALAETVIPDLLRDRMASGLAGQPIRVWIAGCSTGEEAYSLVILFREAMAAAGSREHDGADGTGRGKPLHDGQDLDGKRPDGEAPGRGTGINLQVFASDIDADADAVATAREGLYPASIVADVSKERLARFFSKEDGGGYRVLPDLRAAVVFTVQDLLADPPFSRLDLVSCRNLLIYLGPEAQAKAVALFHFALKEGGALLLGSAETIGEADGRFKLVQKSTRLYRHVGRKRPGDLNFALSAVEGSRASSPGRPGAPSRQAVLAELCRQAVLDAHAPAAVLCNAQFECLYSLGPTDRYLRVAPGHATSDLLAMARGTMRTRLRSALGQAIRGGVRVTVPGGRVVRDGLQVPFSIDVQMLHEGLGRERPGHEGLERDGSGQDAPPAGTGEALLLVCFVDGPPGPPARGSRRNDAAGGDGRDAPRIAELERELEAVRAELAESARLLEATSEDQCAVNEEALSVNEEYQSTNEELLTSKEELQSLNEELQALNSQLQESLERQRTTANDLQNILYSTDVATLFLDRDLGIRFFTPATRALFNVIPGDVGRPLSDLHSLATDTLLPADAKTVLDTLDPVEREVETPSGTWFRRRILPYRTEGPWRRDDGAKSGVEGVVITFNDITRRKQAAAALEEAKQAAEAANLTKSRFLAAASHDLRQPLQTLALLQGLLARNVIGDKAQGLVTRLDETLGAMSGMLDTLLDLNQIEAGVVQPTVEECWVGVLLDRLRDEFIYHAHAKGLALRVMPCSAVIRTDPQLLEQMLRNLVSNALKYTERGRVLLGCRRVPGALRIEVWDTGVGIPDAELEAVFDEYHQIDNAARERSRGLGLGLSIVQRLGSLLGHPVRVRSRPGKGSVFTIEVARISDADPHAGGRQAGNGHAGGGNGLAAVAGRTGTILVVEDDPDLRDLLRLLLEGCGYHVATAPDGIAALALVAGGAGRPDLVRPDLVLADLNLPGGLDGLQAAARLRTALQRPVPVIILSGDTSAALRATGPQDCMHLSKPVKTEELTQAIQQLLSTTPGKPAGAALPTLLPRSSLEAVVFVVDDDDAIRAAMRAMLEEHGLAVEDYPDGAAFLATMHPGRVGCLLVDAAMPGMDGFEVLRRLDEARLAEAGLGEAGRRLPAIVITGHGDVSMAVRAMKAGALDFIEKPVSAPDLLAGISRALDQSRDAGNLLAWRAAAAASIAGLTGRQRDVMMMVLAGQPSKNIAADLGISQRTVENHRASIMRKTGTRSLPALARLALAASPTAEGR